MTSLAVHDTFQGQQRHLRSDDLDCKLNQSYSETNTQTTLEMSSIQLSFNLCSNPHLHLCCAESLSHVLLFATRWTIACQAPLSMGILQARILGQVDMPSSRGSSQPRDRIQVSCITGGFFTISATREAKEHWSGSPIPSPGELPDPGIELGSPACRQILYQLSYQEAPFSIYGNANQSCSQTLFPQHAIFYVCFFNSHVLSLQTL